MSESAAGAGLPIPAEVIAQLTEAAVGFAAYCQDMNPAEAAAVATTQANALQLLFGSRIPDSQQVPVYVITMTGRFIGRHAPPLAKHPEGTVLTVTLDARTLRMRDLKISDQDHRALLPQLGPVSILPIRDSKHQRPER
jgi:hypothetical protein